MSRYIPLSPQRFADLRWQRFSDYRHARGQHLVPVSAPEASQVAAHLPLVFARDEAGQALLCALTGLREATNHCLDANDKWQAGYVPAFWRTHPFRLMAPPKGQGDANQRVLCADVDSPWVGEQGREAFLDADQQMTPAVKEVFDFLGKLTRHHQLTQQAVNTLSEAGLLTKWQFEDHQGKTIGGLQRVDETALNTLDDATFASLRKNGALAIAYAQMISTHQLPRLQTLARQNDPQMASAPPQDIDSFFGDDDELSFDFDR